jgi:hypothetical protein
MGTFPFLFPCSGNARRLLKFNGAPRKENTSCFPAASRKDRRVNLAAPRKSRKHNPENLAPKKYKKDTQIFIRTENFLFVIKTGSDFQGRPPHLNPPAKDANALWAMASAGRERVHGAG